MLLWKSRPAMMGSARGRIGPSDCMFTRIWVTLMFMICRAIQEARPLSWRPENQRDERGIGGSRDSQSSTRIINYGQNNVLDKLGLEQPCTALLYSVLLHFEPFAKYQEQRSQPYRSRLTSTARTK